METGIESQNGLELNDLSLNLNLESYNFTRLIAEVSDEDVNRTLLILRRQQADWSKLDSAAQLGDRVTINCYAKLGDRVFDSKGMRVEISDDDDANGFEQGLKGVSAGEKLPIEINFDNDHYQADIAGKTAVFNVEVIAVESLVLPELDADFIRSNGIESGEVEAMRNVIHRNMHSHLQKTIRLKNTLNLFADILNDHPVEVPKAMLDEELIRVTCDPCEEVEGVESFKHDIDPGMFVDLAYTRVARGLMAAELARQRNVELDEAEVRLRLEDLVAEYPQQEKIIEWFYDDAVRLAGIVSDVLGEQVANQILDEMKAEKITTSYVEMMDFKSVVK